MDSTERISLIAQIPLFASLPRTELEHLANKLQPREFPPGAVMLREGECDEHFYILLEGEVEVIKALGSSDERQLAVKPSGALLGEMSLFNPQGCHTSSVLARATVQTLEMTRQDFDGLLHRHPALVYEMLRRMSQRLEGAENTTILDLREKNRQLTQAYQELKAAQAQLIIKEKLERELDIARQIQESILPESVPRLEGFDIAALTIPARAVGGDYYDFFPLDGDRIGLVTGDACDKGIPAALFINLTNSLVHIEAPRNPSPEATLRLVNQHLLEMNRSGMFATMLYGVLDASGRLDYCRAGHPYPVVLNQNQRPIEIHANNGMPLGLLEEIQLDVQTVTIPIGGIAVMYSDGLNEALDSNDRQFGVARLASELPPISHLPAEYVCTRLWELVQSFVGDQPQIDDFTVMVIKRLS
jgi:sigma-B regulation protein RsbU (phosphoserine phosphatase)